MPQVTGSWTAKTCEACHTTKHTTYTAGTHTATTSGCALGGCHGGVTRRAHAARQGHRRLLGERHGQQGLGGSCHQLDKPMAGTTMTCGDTGACHTGHDCQATTALQRGRVRPATAATAPTRRAMEDGLGTTTGSAAPHRSTM